MKSIMVGLVLLLLILATPESHAQITSNVFERVLNVRVPQGTATAFTIDVDGREYLITAKHVVQGLKDSDTIDIFKNDHWSSIPVRIFRCESPVDIAVLVPPYQLTVNFPLPFDNQDIQFGQEAYFLGFPYGLSSPAHGVNGPYPLALVKRGTFSGDVSLDPTKKAVLIYLDGMNNPGFSGGPIVYRDYKMQGYDMRVIGVVSGFRPDVVPAMYEHDIKSPADASPAAKAQPWKIQQRSNGTYFEYVNNGTFVALNTGIVQGYLLEPAIDLIRQHPIGPKVTDSLANNANRN